jgi:hypothetical protein
MILTQYLNITPLLEFVSHIVFTATVYSDDFEVLKSGQIEY